MVWPFTGGWGGCGECDASFLREDWGALDPPSLADNADYAAGADECQHNGEARMGLPVVHSTVLLRGFMAPG
jgi:hypothetical protein